MTRPGIESWSPRPLVNPTYLVENEGSIKIKNIFQQYMNCMSIQFFLKIDQMKLRDVSYYWFILSVKIL